MKKALFVLFAVFLGASGAFIFQNLPVSSAKPAATAAKPDEPIEIEQEKHLRNVKQLSFGGENAEAYFSFDGKKLIFQSKRDNRGCDQIYTMNAADGSDVKMVSNGDGRTTCSYFYKKQKKVLFASTHLGDKQCPKPAPRQGYAWDVFPTYDIFTAKPDGSDLKQLTKTNGYDAEATISPDGKKIVFTSLRDGDLDIYTMDTNGKNVKRLTSELGYDGGAFFSPDNKSIVYRSYQPNTPEQIARYKQKLAENIIEPNNFEIWTMNIDGSNKKQITKQGAASFAPFFTPDGKRIIFSSNLENPRGRNFDLYLVNLDGSNLERVTYTEVFDGFPMFSPDGKKIAFASNRNAKQRGDTNIFIADWVE